MPANKYKGFTGATTVARCTRCFYELDYNEVELDVHLNGMKPPVDVMKFQANEV